MTYKISTIASILGVDVPPMRGADAVSILLTDSRALVDPQRSIFLALRTAAGDGHRYILELYRRGVRHFVVDHLPTACADAMPGATVMQVPSVIAALQSLGAHHRRRFDAPVIGITGSAGKTVVKEWLYQMLHRTYAITRSPRSYNSQIGVPLSVWEMTPQTTLGIFEAGIDSTGQMKALHDIIRPTIGVITNVTSEHDEGFPSRLRKAQEKALLLAGCDAVVYNADDPLVAQAVEEAVPPERRFGWSLHRTDAQAMVTDVDRGSASTSFTISGAIGTARFSIPFTTDADLENALHCTAVAMYLRLPSDLVGVRLATLTPVATRLNVIEGVNNCTLVHDAYTTDIPSLGMSLDFMNRRAVAGRTTTAILSDAARGEAGGPQLYRSCAAMLRAKGVTRVIGIGREITSYGAFFDMDKEFFPSTDEFMAQLAPGDFNNEFILLKGAPRFHFERIAEVLEARHQETVMEVNLDALVSNYKYYRAHLPQTTGLVGMVKASAYGAGSLEVAKTLQAQGASYLAVAVLDEGVELRRAGIRMPIMVLNPRVLNYRALFTHDLEPEIYSFNILDEVLTEARKWGMEDYPIHLKLDTGMHRLGFIESELPRLIEILRGQSYVRVASVFSHLATADCLDQDQYTHMQLDTFDRCCDTLQAAFPDRRFLRHILNSAGITRFGSHRHDDLARLGIGLYGISPIPDDAQTAHHLRPVSSLTTIITALRHWPAGATIGYSRRGVLERPTVVATLPIGYADGLPRSLGNGEASFMVRGHRCPTVGNICMDSCMIDVTDVADPGAQIGDTVQIFGRDIPVEEVADHMGTIPYEVLTGISRRVKRIYYRE